MYSVEQQSIHFPISDGHFLHLRYIYPVGKAGDAVFFMHGAVENGKIFYTESNKGLAPFLASQGYHCYVADLRGRGGSTPPIDGNAEYGQTEAIMQEFPAFLAKITEHSGKFPRFWVAHSWGGVLMNSVFARFPDYIDKVDACAYFGSKRALYNRHITKLFQADLLWYWRALHHSKKHGYLPAKKLKWGSDNESKKSHYQSMMWAKRLPWVDSDDGFDYAEALKDVALPPIYHVAGVKDKALAQPIDIKMFMEESGKGEQKLAIYGKRYGHQVNYNHINMLTHKQAEQEQFKDVIAWFEQHRKES